MPGHYENNSFDLAGFCVGAVEREKLLNPNTVKKGDAVIGVSSSGIHSNGFSLIRKILDTYSIDLFQKSDFDKTKSFSDLLMQPTLLYNKAFQAANKSNKVKSVCHITGGGLIENPPRSFNKKLTLNFDMNNYEMPPLFQWIKEKANISLYEMLKTFNCGIGLLIFVDEKDKIDVLNNIKNVGYDAFLIGSMEEKNSNKDVYFEGWGF